MWKVTSAALKIEFDCRVKKRKIPTRIQWFKGGVEITHRDDRPYVLNSICIQTASAGLLSFENRVRCLQLSITFCRSSIFSISSMFSFSF